ncbi:MAG: hypothetical protein ABJ327_19240 [Litoreibacter sp.]
MDKKITQTPRATRLGKPQTREDRLKAALKANMGRRKAQARARTEIDTDTNKAD